MKVNHGNSPKETLDTVIGQCLKSKNKNFQEMGKELVIMRSMEGDKATERWLFIQMRLNVMRMLWNK